MPMATITLLAPAPPFSQFDPAAFEHAAGQPVELRIGSALVLESTIVSARVIDRGAAVTLQIEAGL